MSDSTLLPALDGRDPLCFLAALGSIRLLDTSPGKVRLSWDAVSCGARFLGAGDSDEIIGSLARTFESTDGQRVLPDLPSQFHSRPGAAKASTDLTRVQYHEFVEHEAMETSGDPLWLDSLLTDLAVRPAKKTGEEPKCALTPYVRVNQNSSVLHELANARQGVLDVQPLLGTEGVMRASLIQGRRFDGQFNGYLSNRALRSAAEVNESGNEAAASPQYRGVPALAWLAFNALPWLPTSGTGQRLRAVGWRTRDGRDELVWPIWSQPLTGSGIRVLMDHPVLRREPPEWLALRALGVTLRGVATFAGSNVTSRIKALKCIDVQRPGA